jgi:hypothetical protein
MNISKHVQKIIDEYGISVTADMKYAYTINHDYGSVAIMPLPKRLGQKLTAYSLFPIVAPYSLREGASSDYVFTWDDYDKQLWQVQYAVCFIGLNGGRAYRETAKYALETLGGAKRDREEREQDSELTSKSIPRITYDTNPLPCKDELKPMTAYDIFKCSFRGRSTAHKHLLPLVERAVELSPWETIYSNSEGQ